jgi:hypothetical protein
MSETAWDRELVLAQLGILADVRAKTERLVELLEDDDGEEAQED